MPGFPKGLHHYESFDSHINIIAGPNASGKSSTAAAIQHIIWPRLGNDLQVRAQVSIGEEGWVVEKRMSQTIIQSGGQESELPVRPSLEQRRRYLLALHDLMRVEDKKLAQLIIQESVGGYDLERAASELNYSDRISNRGTSEYQKYQKAIKKYDETYRKQLVLKNRQQELSALEEQKQEAEKALELDKLYGSYQQYRETYEELKRLKHQLKDFPEGLDRAAGDEAERLTSIDETITKKQSDVQSLDHEIEKARSELEEISLPESGISDQKIDLLRQQVTKIKDLQYKIEDKISEAEKEREQIQNILQSLQIEDGEIELEEFNAANLTELEEWLQKVYQITGRRQLMKEELEFLRENRSEAFKKDTVREGMRLLERWLRDSAGGRDYYPHWIFWSLMFVGIATSLAVYVWGAMGLWGFLIMGLLAIYALMRQPSANRIGGKDQFKEDYRSTDLPVPDRWNAYHVIETIDQLAEELSNSYHEERRQLKIQQLQQDITRLEQGELKELQEQQERLKSSIKAVPRLLEESGDSYSRFYWYVNRLNQWRQALDRLRGYEKAIDQLKSDQKEVFDKFNREIEPFDQENPETGEEADAVVKDLERMEQRRKEAARRIEDKTQQRRKYRREIEQLEKQAQKIYEKFGLKKPDIGEVERRLQMLDTYRELQKRYTRTEYGMDQRKSELEDHPLYESYRSQLEQMEEDEIEREREQLQKQAERSEELQEEIHEIKTRVRQVQDQHDLEEALQQKEEAVAGLESLYQDNIASLTGFLLTNKIKQITKDQNRPAVFNRATELFNRITSGQFNLLIDEDGPRFRAYDTVQDKGKTLDQLSTGTRIQLLLAVRIAFIETQEQSMQLPLLADELLANSDEVRANAIIKALVQMSREGRQIFYFTAQADEVYKWRTYLDERDISYRLHEIGQESGKGFAYYESYRPPRDMFQLSADVPAPEDNKHSAYGQQLEVPPFNIVVDSLNQLHLWYLIEEVDVLYECLKRQIRFWGELQSFKEYGGTIPGLDNDTWQHLTDKMKWLERFRDLYKQGRPLPVDRSVLEATDAVTDNFIEEVAAKLRELEGNPEHLLESLRNGEVSGFRKTKLEELENYLLENNYIDDNDPIPLDDIRSRLQAYLEQLSISRAEIEGLLDRILSD